MQKQPMKVQELEQIIDAQLRVMHEEDVRLDNKTFARQVQKTKEISNLAGKKIAVIAQQLYANEMGAQIAVPSLDIPEGFIPVKRSTKLTNLLH